MKRIEDYLEARKKGEKGGRIKVKKENDSLVVIPKSIDSG